MRIAMVRCLFREGIQRWKGVPSCGLVPGFSNDQQIRPIRMAHSTTQVQLPPSSEERRDLMALWPDVVKDLTESGLYSEISDATKHLAKALQYNVAHSEKLCALSLVTTYRMVAPPEQVTEENLRRVRIVGWCHELILAFSQVMDDIMDRSETRRKQPCWYRHNNLGLPAINDGLLIEQAAYYLLSMHFNKEEYYVELFETFHEMTMQIALGEALDLFLSNGRDQPNLSLFTMERYLLLVKFKIAQHIILAPVKSAMQLAGITDFEKHRQAMTILIDFGQMYQVRDDYLDCYGDPNVTGKIGSDIQRGKCTWLVVSALERATPSQKLILQECYGCDDPERVARVKQLYSDLNLAEMHAEYERENYNLVRSKIEQVSCGFPRDLLFKFLSMLPCPDA